MTRYFRIVLLAGLILAGSAFTSCKGGLDLTGGEGDMLSYDKEATVTFSLKGDKTQISTKASFGDANNVDENTLYCWDVYIYSGGQLLFYQEDCLPTDEVSCTLSRADIQNVNIYFFGNILSEVLPKNNEDDFLGQRIFFSDHFEGYGTAVQGKCVMPMYKFFLDYNLASSPTMEVSLDRICCKILLDEVNSNGEYGTTPHVDEFRLRSYYLINTVNAIAIWELAAQRTGRDTYDDPDYFWFSHANPLWTYRTTGTFLDVYYDFGSVTDAAYKGNGSETDPYNLFGYTDLSLEWSDEGTIYPSRNSTHALYCFPNFIPGQGSSSPNATRLVIEAIAYGTGTNGASSQIKGSFYSIPVIRPGASTMLPNMEYHITCAISHTGGDCPDIPDPLSMQSTVTAEAWNPGYWYTIEY